MQKAKTITLFLNIYAKFIAVNWVQPKLLWTSETF